MSKFVLGKSYEVRLGSSEYPRHVQAIYIGESVPVGMHKLENAKDGVLFIHESNIEIRAREAAVANATLG